MSSWKSPRERVRENSTSDVTYLAGGLPYYAPYGQVLNRSMRDGPGYTGHEEDPATGLVYMQQRYYDPQSGRFLSTDPVLTNGNGGSFNRYAYADDNPYTHMDPTGMCTGTHICNQDGTAVSSGDFTTQARNAHLVGASAAQRGRILGLPVKGHLSHRGLQFIAKHEGGPKLKAYPDLYGNSTIGYGHLIRNGEKFSTITRGEALKLLSQDAQTAVRFVNSRVKVSLLQTQFDALTDTAFNSERAALMIIKLANKYQDITIRSFIDTLPSGYLSPIGVQNRRGDEANLYLNGNYQ